MSHREALLRAARQLVVEKGFAATTARDLASVAQVPLGALNYHFRSKDDLLVQALADVIDAWVKEPVLAAEAAANQGLDAAQQLQALERAARRRIAERPLEAAAFLEGAALAARRPDIRDVLERRLVASKVRLQVVVARSGIAADPLAVEPLTQALIALHDGFVIQAALGHRPPVSLLELVPADALRQREPPDVNI
jgi:AcrR family transcriptional regulator